MSGVEGWFYEVNGERKGPVALRELKELARTKVVTRSTKVWAEGMGDPIEASKLAMLYPPRADAGMSWLLPVGRSGFAIAAGYLGLFSPIPFVGLLALVFSGLAIWDLRRNPEKRGWGRVVFGLIMGLLFSVSYAALIFSR